MQGANKCNLESVDGSNTLGQSVSIKWGGGSLLSWLSRAAN